MVPIAIDNVTLEYDTPAGKVTGVKDVSFDIEASEFLYRRAVRLRQVDAA